MEISAFRQEREVGGKTILDDYYQASEDLCPQLLLRPQVLCQETPVNTKTLLLVLTLEVDFLCFAFV